jgi:hypothetical protein
MNIPQERIFLDFIWQYPVIITLVSSGPETESRQLQSRLCFRSKWALKPANCINSIRHNISSQITGSELWSSA